MIVSVLIAVLVVSLIGAFLAALLVVSEFYLASYGPCKITINNEKEVTREGGSSLLASLVEEKIFIPSACGGKGTCGLCKVKVLDGAGPLLPTEEPFLSPEEIDDRVRLSCQIKVKNDISIAIPDELLSISEYESKCSDIIDLTHDIKLFKFELIEPDTMDYVPGQYIQLQTPPYEKSSEAVYRAYSLAGDPADKNTVELIIRLVPGGICTTYCFEHLEVGSQMKMNGPYGDFRLSQTDAPMVFIAGGSGMAPIRNMLYHIRNAGIERKATYFFGANTVADLFMTDEMRQFESDLTDFTYVPAVAAPAENEKWDGEKGLVTEVVRRNVENASEAEGYLCGSPGMIDAAVDVLIELGMKEENIFYDKFA